MPRKSLLICFATILSVLASALAVTAQGPNPQSVSTSLSTAFTYQGQLKQNGAVVNGTRSLAFRLYDAPSGGTLLGNITQTLTISNGLFTTLLDFGNQFNGDERYLGIAVGTDSELLPRQRLSAVPYSIRALHANAADVATTALNAWSLMGNTATSPTDFIGTSDNMTLTLGVSGTAMLRFVPAYVLPANFFVDGGLFTPNFVVGPRNAVGPGTAGAAIGGGSRNVASSYFAAIGGGALNNANGFASTIGGGLNNNVAYNFGTIAGGQSNSAAINAAVGGGVLNGASGLQSTIGGGEQNSASGTDATVPGGFQNRASGDYSLAAGANARAIYSGTFVWADSSTSAPISATAPNQFIVRASGGFGIGTNSPQGPLQLNSAVEPPFGLPSENNGLMLGSAGTAAYKWMQSYGGALTLNPQGNNVGIGITNPVHLLELKGGAYSDGATWNIGSDRNAKMNFAGVDPREVLAKVKALPIETWNYKTQAASIRHLGPMAQDFAAAFGLGADDTHISTVDEEGVALAAIQGLYQIVQEQQTEIAQLKAEVSPSGQAAQTRSMVAQPDGLLPLLVGLSLTMNVLLGTVLLVHLRKGGRP